MREFTDDRGAVWVADAREEETPRHHGRWYLVFHAAGAADAILSMPEVRWQTSATAARTLRTMSVFELRRRLGIVRARAVATGEPDPAAGASSPARERTSASAG